MEDGVNIINSIGKIEFIDIQNAISDALDFDYSNIEIGSINVNNAKGDCLDFSFGNYSINESVLNNCRDKAISVGETSKLKGININITNANFGIASKDNSIANIKTLNIKKLNIV